MQLCRFGYDLLGVVEGDLVRDVTEALELLPALRYPLPTARRGRLHARSAGPRGSVSGGPARHRRRGLLPLRLAGVRSPVGWRGTVEASDGGSI